MGPHIHVTNPVMSPTLNEVKSCMNRCFQDSRAGSDGWGRVPLSCTRTLNAQILSWYMFVLGFICALVIMLIVTWAHLHRSAVLSLFARTKAQLNSIHEIVGDAFHTAKLKTSRYFTLIIYLSRSSQAEYTPDRKSYSHSSSPHPKISLISASASTHGTRALYILHSTASVRNTLNDTATIILHRHSAFVNDPSKRSAEAAEVFGTRSLWVDECLKTSTFPEITEAMLKVRKRGEKKRVGNEGVEGTEASRVDNVESGDVGGEEAGSMFKRATCNDAGPP